MSLLVSSLDSISFPSVLRLPSTTFSHLQCLAAYYPGFPSDLKDLVMRASTQGDQKDVLKRLETALLATDEAKWRQWLGSTKDVEKIIGGYKVGMAAKTASAIVGTRIADWR